MLGFAHTDMLMMLTIWLNRVVTDTGAAKASCDFAS